MKRKQKIRYWAILFLLVIVAAAAAFFREKPMIKQLAMNLSREKGEKDE